MIAIALAKYLTTKALAVYNPLTGTGNCFIAHAPATPDELVAITPYGGNPTSGTQGYDEPTVQIRTRGKANDPLGPYLTGLAIYAALQGLHAITLDPGGPDEIWLLRCLSTQSAPVPIGQDINGRYEYSLNFACHVRALTANRV